MKHLLFATSLLFFSQSVFSQTVEFCPKGATWDLRKTNFLSPHVDWIRRVYSKDTVVAGQPCKKVDYYKDGKLIDPNYDVPFLYQKEDSIFGWDFDKWGLLFKTRLVKGDSLKLKTWGGSQVLSLNVDSTDFLIFNQLDTVHRAFVSWNGGSLPFPIYDRFGPLLGFNFKEIFAISDAQYQVLSCYSDSGFVQINLTNKPCDFTETEEPNPPFDFLILPNPTTDFLQIAAENSTGQPLELSLFDAFGRQILTAEKFILPEKLDVANLPGGLYFLKIGDENQGFSVRRFVKI